MCIRLVCRLYKGEFVKQPPSVFTVELEMRRATCRAEYLVIDQPRKTWGKEGTTEKQVLKF